MKKSMYLVAATAVALASCSTDELVQQKDGSEINFSVVADNDSRAATVYCNNNLMKGFNLYAGYNNGSWSTFIEEDYVTVLENGKCTQTETRYWPETGNLTFFGLVNTPANEFTTMIPASNATSEVVWGAEVPVVKDFTPDTDVTKQTDLLYAVAAGCTKAAAPVQMNFRHALSQIEFRAKNQNPQLHVVIDAVRVGQTDAQGTYSLPSESTVPNYETHDQSTQVDDYVKGTWSDVKGKADYLVEFNSVAVPYSEGAVQNLTISNDGAELNNNSLLLIPTMEDGEATTPWTPANAATYDGTYLAIYCTIYNVAGAEYVEGSDVAVLHKGWAVIPVSFKWKQGKKYIYTFNFSKEGNGGYEGGDDIEDNTPTDVPVLTGIELTVTVDDFVYGDNYVNDMDTEATEYVALNTANFLSKIAQGGSFILDEDVNLGDNSAVFTKDSKLNLNGHTVKGGKVYVAGQTTGADISALVVDNGATLTITGEGAVEGNTYGVYAKNGTLNIEGGKYSAETSAVQVAQATVNISGGEFSNTASDKTYTINCLDANWKNGTAIVNITGGKYTDFNPANNAAEGVGTNFVADGYVSAAEGDYYVVKAGQEFFAGNVTLNGDVNIGKGIVVSGDVNLNLNGYSIVGGIPYSSGATGSDIAALVVENGTLTISGDGSIQGTEYGVYAKKGNVVIKGGNFSAITSAVQVYVGKVTIEGGNFSNTSTDKRYTINSIDGTYKNGQAVIEIKGGKFEGFNPANNAAEGAGTNFVADGYKAAEVSTGVWEVVSAGVSTAAELIESIAQGGQVVLTSDVTLSEALVVEKATKINLNGKTIKAATPSKDAIIVAADGSLVIEGNGEIEAVSGGDGYSIIAEGELTINGGTFKSGIDQNGEPNAVIYARGNGKVYVNGGYFPNDNTSKFVLNKKDADRATTVIEVKGGTFENFNPADNAAEGPGTNFVAAGYKAEKIAAATWKVVAE